MQAIKYHVFLILKAMVKLSLILKYVRTDFGGAPTIFFNSMHAYARMKTVNAKGMNQGVVKYRYFSTPCPEYNTCDHVHMTQSLEIKKLWEIK